MTWGPEDEAKHPRNPDDGRWVDHIVARMGPTIYDTLTHPEFGNATAEQQQAAEQWAQQLAYPDREAGVRSQISSVEHAVDGFSVNGRFVRGRADETVGTWSVAILKEQDEHGTPVAAVDEINIDPAWQGKGIAGRWARRFEHAVRQSGGREISMWDQSGGFWAHLGYVRDRFGIGRKQL